MKLNLFVLADSVEMYGGRLAIVGIFDKFIANDMPTLTRPIDLAFKIQGEKKDYGKTYDGGRLILRKINSKKSLLEAQFSVKFDKPKDEAGTHCVGVLHISPLKLSAWGKYIFELEVASKLIGGISFFAVKPQKETKKKKVKKSKKKSGTKK